MTLEPLPSELSDIPRERLPRHIAIIMDGNGRWARQRGMPRIEGHRNGAESVRRVTEACARLGIEQITLYCLSSENWKRPAEELRFLLELLKQYMIEQRSTIIEHHLRVSIIGRREGLPEDVLREMDETVALSRGNQGLHVCLAINYGSRAELVDAIRQITAQAVAGKLTLQEITEATVDRFLDTAGMPDPDLLIRTAGEMRVSNFLLWQISYAELWVTDRCWPDFTEAELYAAIRAFAARNRSFGGLNG